MISFQKNIKTHGPEEVEWIKQSMADIGIDEFRFCSENDCYVCDRNGNFYSVCTRQMSKAGNLIEKYRVVPLKGSVDKYGYLTYRVTVGGIKKHLKAHRMMMNAWVTEEPDLVVNHIDGDKQNNALSNLEWCTVAENNAHAIRTGLFDPHMKKNVNYTIPPADWITIYILHKHCGYSFSELGRMYGCVHDTIKKITERLDRVMPVEVVNG